MGFPGRCKHYFPWRSYSDRIRFHNLLYITVPGYGRNAFQFAGNEVTGDDAAGFTVDHHHIQHFMTGEHMDTVPRATCLSGAVSTKAIAARLPGRIKVRCTCVPPNERLLRRPAVFAGEGHALGTHWSTILTLTSASLCTLLARGAVITLLTVS